MKLKVGTLLPLFLLGVALTSNLRAQEGAASDAERELAEKGVEITKKYCYRCHGIKFEVDGFDILDRKTLLAPAKADHPAYVVPGKIKESLIWQRVFDAKDMPPEGAELPSDAEKEIFKQWIEKGAPFPPPPKRSFKRLDQVLASIARHLKTVPDADRKFQKFFTLTQFYNNPKISDDELRQSRAALSKLVNSLSWKRNIVVPQPVDEDQAVYTVDIRQLGWDRKDLWKEVLRKYPYGVKYSEGKDETVRELAEEVNSLSGDQIPFVRADWFIATASRPPLYHIMLELPDNVSKLQAMLNVDVEADFNENLLARAGFTTSAVSDQNRVVDRHHSLYGAYWHSYDFKPNGEKSSILKFPLGPTFASNQFKDQAFEHDGGEIIFHLPNGLQGYYLIDNKGKRIDEGPTDVVHDKLTSAGKVAVVNGISCIACHKEGMRDFTDSLRLGNALVGRDAIAKLQKLVPKQSDMDALVKADRDLFLESLDQAVGLFLKTGPDKDKSIADLAKGEEPIGVISRLYVKDLGPVEVALDLGVEDVKLVQFAVAGNRLFQEIGLGPLAEGSTIKREDWQSFSGTKDKRNLFHIMADQLRQGSGVVEP